MINYPLKFHPILKEKIWGGDKLKTLLNKKSDLNNLGESWEISGVKDSISIVSNGEYSNQPLTALIKKYKGLFLGQKIYDEFGERFPLLIKFIDAKYDLSVQLHPDDELANDRHNSFGKAEMWHVIQADDNSKLIVGFNTLVDENTYVQTLKNGNITSLLNFIDVNKQDSFFINTGTIHAIGSGVLIAEIQQTSDITYRVFDWNRKDFNGEERELHSDLALKAINYNSKDYQKLSYDRLHTPSNIINNEYFTTNYISIRKKLARKINQDSFTIYMCVQGNGVINVNNSVESISLGETILIPAMCNEVIIEGDELVLLEIYIDNKKL